MRFFLPYATTTLKGKLALFKIQPNGTLDKLWEWPHSNITATVRRASDKIIALIDYERRRIYRIENGKPEEVGEYATERGRSGFAVARGERTEIWYSPGQSLWCIGLIHETGEVKKQLPFQIHAEEIVVDVGHIVVAGLGLRGNLLMEHGICFPSRKDTVVAIPVHLGLIPSPTSRTFQWSRLKDAPPRYGCVVDAVNRRLWEISWLSTGLEVPVYTFAAAEKWGKVVQIALSRGRQERFLWLLYQGDSATPHRAVVSPFPARQILVDSDATYVSCLEGHNIESCLVFQRDGTAKRVRVDAGVPYAGPADTMMERMLELCANIKDGKRPFPISQYEDDPLWCCALVADNEYAEKCSAKSWIPRGLSVV